MNREQQFRNDFELWGKETQFRIAERYTDVEGSMDDLAIADTLGYLVQKSLQDKELFKDVYTHYLKYFAEHLDYTQEDYITFDGYRLFVYNCKSTINIDTLIKLTILPNDELIPKDIWCTVIAPNVAKDRITGNLLQFRSECVKTQLIPLEPDDIED